MDIKIPEYQNKFENIFSYISKQIKEVELNNYLFKRDYFANTTNANFKMIDGNDTKMREIGHAMNILNSILSENGYADEESLTKMNESVKFFEDVCQNGRIPRNTLRFKFVKTMLEVSDAFFEYNNDVWKEHEIIREVVGGSFNIRYRAQKRELNLYNAKYLTAKKKTDDLVALKPAKLSKTNAGKDK